MNDPDRRRSPDGFDDDAIFADIVAHLNDVPAETGGAARPVADDEATILEATDPEATDLGAPGQASDETTAEPTHQPSAGEPRGDLGPWSIGQPPELPTDVDPQPVSPPQLWRAHQVDDEVEEHFEPPPATPLPAGDLQFWAIIAGMGGGPLMLLYLVFFNREASSIWILAAIAMSVGGFALLVLRMPGHHEDDDDGARL